MSCIGGHVSVAGGLLNGIEKAKKIGAKTIQIFGASPRQWACRMPNPEAVQNFLEAIKKSNIESVFLHAPYLVNLGTPNDEQWLKSVKVLIEHMHIAELIHAQGLIFHVGSFNETTRTKGLARASKAMKLVLKHAPGKAQLIMENSAGGPNKIGSSFDDLAELSSKVKSARVSVCLDTAHAFEAGIIKAYTPKLIKDLFDDFDQKIGLEKLVVLHVNDSKTAFNSHHDRHDNIGEGYIGLEGFRNLAKEKRVREKPWILEVPGFDKHGPDKRNIQLLESCFQ